MLDLRMWALALTKIPRLDQVQWQSLDVISKWLIACRASVLFMTLASASLGGLLAWRDNAFSWQPWILVTLGLLFAHATNNLLNDYTDSQRGVDKNNYYRNQYGVHILEDGLVSTKQFWHYIVLTGGIAIALGALLIWQHGGISWHLMLAGSFFVVFYTWPLKYLGLGEPAVLLVWGPLMVGGCYYIVSGQWSWPVTWLSLVFALGPTGVLFGKHTDKLIEDLGKGVYTLPVRIGEGRSRVAITVLLAMQYVMCIALVFGGGFHWSLLLVLVNAPYFFRVAKTLREAKPESKPTHYSANIWPLWFSAHVFGHTRRFSSFFLAGILIDALLQ